MTGIFRANNPLNASILFVYGLLLKWPYLSHQLQISHQPSDGYLFETISQIIKPAAATWPALIPILTYLLLFVQATTLNFYINSQKMAAKPNYLCGMAYLLVTSFFPEWNVFSAALIVNTIMIWIVIKLLTLGSMTKVKGTLFNLGFTIGICSLLYLPSVTLLLIVIFGLIIMRAPRLAEWAMVFLGFITLWYFLLAWLFLTDRLYSYQIGSLRFGMAVDTFTTEVNIRLGTILFMFLLGIYLLQTEIMKLIIQIRSRWNILLVGAVALILTPFLNKNIDLTNWIISIFFISPFVGIAFYFINSKWVRIILHWGMVGMILYFQYFR